MTNNAVEDVLEWAAKLSEWKRDALRRLACDSKLSESDVEEVWDHLMAHVGLPGSHNSSSQVALEKGHLSSSLSGGTKTIRCIRNVNGVNQLLPKASLEFEPNGLTVIYGRNGAGKSGFVRIFRSACRTRIENAETLKILSDVYGTETGPQEAEIVLVDSTGEYALKWASGQVAMDELMHVSVFDSAAAQLYINKGNQIQFLPFGMALPHLLNEVCLRFKEKIDPKLAELESKLELTDLNLPSTKETRAFKAYRSISAETENLALDKMSTLTAEDLERLTELNKVFSASSSTPDSLREFARWIARLSKEAASLAERLSAEALERVSEIANAATTARHLASLKAEDLFVDEPLQGVGENAWRTLWRAARDYSVGSAYLGTEYPVIERAEGEALCVLCQQELSDEAKLRMQRFSDYMADTLEQTAQAAEQLLSEAAAATPYLDEFLEDEWDIKLARIEKQDKECATLLNAFRSNIIERIASYSARANGEKLAKDSAQIEQVWKNLDELKASLEREADILDGANNKETRHELEAEHAELFDLQALRDSLRKLVSRRDLLVEKAKLLKASTEISTTGNTKKANTLVEEHLKEQVIETFRNERKQLEIEHLRVTLERKSGQQKAEFETTTGSSLTKRTSDFLSEGEQRALALAAFFTEISVTDGAGPIVVDDPVSSLDRQRSNKVARRLVTEAANRQVIVFTHDLVFFNELCQIADDSGIPTRPIALFRDKQHAGKIDPAGVIWKGKSISKRIGPMKNEMVHLHKLHSTSPATYETEAKNLYGRLRDTYERAIEEIVFCGVIQRGVDDVQTLRLRYVHVSHVLAERFHAGMTKASTHSHDNPASETVQSPEPDEIAADIAELENLVADFKLEHKATEDARPSMKKTG